ncbi:MAG: hypothetical protein JNJ92_08155 [Altererythrobacter sp.]|nr:hypothetical protein [Altererythrobacter sp.]
MELLLSCVDGHRSGGMISGVGVFGRVEQQRGCLALAGDRAVFGARR